VVKIYITEPEDLQLIKNNVEGLKMGSLLNVYPCDRVQNHYWVELLVEEFSFVYLLGRYVGCDRKRLLDLDF
jgi:hypothetical protein